MAKPADLLARASERLRKDAGTVLRRTPAPTPEGVPRRTAMPTPEQEPVAGPAPDAQPPTPAATAPKRHTFDFAPLMGRPSSNWPPPAEQPPTVLRGTDEPAIEEPAIEGASDRDRADAGFDSYFKSDPGPAPDSVPDAPPPASEPPAQPVDQPSSFSSQFLELVRNSSNKSLARAPSARAAPAPEDSPATHPARVSSNTFGNMANARASIIRRDGEDPPWDDPLRPAGSMFCAEQWAAARDGGRYNAFEMASASERQLIRLPKPARARLVQRVVDGRVTQVPEAQTNVDQDRRDTMLEYLGPALDGCILFGDRKSVV